MLLTVQNLLKDKNKTSILHFNESEVSYYVTSQSLFNQTITVNVLQPIFYYDIFFFFICYLQWVYLDKLKTFISITHLVGLTNKTGGSVSYFMLNNSY